MGSRPGVDPRHVPSSQRSLAKSAGPNGVRGWPRWDCACAALPTALATTANRTGKRARRVRDMIRLIPTTPSFAPHIGHAVADGGATRAHLGTVHHLLVVRHSSTVFLARPAELGARRARDHVVWRSAKHEVRAGLADLRAIEQQADEMHIGQLWTAARQTVLQRHRADCVAVQAFLDALLQIVVSLIVGPARSELEVALVVDVRH